jgi:tRNA (guanine37-N1)-methyltransferase
MTDTPRLKGAWCAKIITLFPELFPGILGASLTGKAMQRGLWALETIDLRRFGTGKHLQVDDTPAGGGPGLVLRPDVVGRSLDLALGGRIADAARYPRLYLSPRGAPFTQAHAERLARADGVVMLCGRFEGVDQRVIDHYNLEEISLGDFVMSGGEIAAQAMIDATLRLIPGVLGNLDSVQDESFANDLLEHPQYTKPQDWKGRTIPDILLSGHHSKIDAWRRQQAENLTQTRRPDLWARYTQNKG